MKVEMRSEREFLYNEAVSGGSVEASLHGLGGLEHKIDWMGGVAVLMREKFQIYFLRVVTVLFKNFMLVG